MGVILIKLYENIRAGRTYIIAEMSANHAGKLENALAIVHAVKDAGADCLKIRTYTADTMTIDCKNEYFQIHGGLWDGYTLYDLYNQAYTPWEWQPAIKAECEKVDIDFLSTPFDKTAVDFLEDLEIQFYKIASFELVDIPLIEYVASKGKPIILSTGMGSFEEISDAVNAIRSKGNEQIILLKCSSAYPSVPDDMNLRTLIHMRENFRVPVGLSDHSLGSIGAITAVAMGASVIEKHFCLNRSIEIPDAAFSMEPEEFEVMVNDIRTAERALGVVSYDCSESERSSLKFRRSIFAVKDIKRGERFKEENIRCIRPGSGMKPKYMSQLLEQVSAADIKYGTPINASDILQEKKTIANEKNQLILMPADYSDMELLYRWVNESEVRNNSFNTKPVTLQEHESWFKEHIASDECSIWILCLGDLKIGQKRCNILENSDCYVGYSIKSQYRGMGYGTQMLNLVKSKIKETYPEVKRIVAEVKPQNEVSSRTLISAGFTKKSVVFIYDF